MNKVKSSKLPSIFLVLAGPILSYFMISNASFIKVTTYDLHPLSYALIAIWSPLFFSVPALIQSKDRDAYQSRVKNIYSSIIRGVTLPLHLAKNKSTRTIFLASLLGWFSLIIFLITKF